jgi:hypothetical protein
MTLFLTFNFSLLTFNLFSQSRLVFNNNAYLIITGSRYAVINNSNANAITLLVNGGNIISEGELNRVKWNIGTATGTYTIPFTKSAGNKIPLTVIITTAGAGTGSILFSTYGGATWDNNTYRPSDVTNMNSLSGTNNSAYVIDRFWIIDAINYTTKPTATITFTYLDAEWAASGNTITEANLFAQRFNSTLSKWADWFGATGTCITTNNTVSSGSVTPANFFRSWTLVDQGSPLPIELLSFTAHCIPLPGGVRGGFVQWTTASETNNDYFVLERSDSLPSGGLGWASIATIQGAGNSNTLLNYSFTDTLLSPFGGSVYYRLKQVDFDGNYTYSDTIHVSCQEHDIEIINIYPNPSHHYFDYTICSTEDREIVATVIDVLGKTLIRKQEHVNAGINHGSLDVSMLAAGVYYFKIETLKGMSKDSKQILIK